MAHAQELHLHQGAAAAQDDQHGFKLPHLAQNQLQSDQFILMGREMVEEAIRKVVREDGIKCRS